MHDKKNRSAAGNGVESKCNLCFMKVKDLKHTLTSFSKKKSKYSEYGTAPLQYTIM